MKKILVILFTLVMIFGITASAESMIPLAQEQSKALNELGIMKGRSVSDGAANLAVESPVTRAEALTLIERTTAPDFDAVRTADEDYDFAGHWAEDTIWKFRLAGLVRGTTGEGFTYEPERGVTGREFAKILLSCLGYEVTTLDAVYDLGLNANLLSDDYTKTMVAGNITLLRGDCSRLCVAAFTAKTADGEMLYKVLIEKGLYTEKDFEGIISSGGTFSDFLNSQMPKDKNYMFSPLSIKAALALFAAGASGETRQEILDAIGIESAEDYAKILSGLTDKYSSSDVITLEIANSIWLNKSKTDNSFGTGYKNKVKSLFGAEAQDVIDSDAVRRINGFVNEKTHGKITEIIETPNFEAFLLNAVYFNADWRTPFEKNATYPETFTSRDGSDKKIDFMHRTGYYSYAEKDGCRILAMPYKNISSKQDGEYSDGEYSIGKYDFDVNMYIILGDETPESPEYLLDAAQFSYERVKLSIPKFKIEFSTGLNDILQLAGIKKAFSDFAETYGMFNNGNMSITSSIHKTYINVDEQGTEAAAVTGLLAVTAIPAEPIDFTADKPFTFVIRDDKNDEILFMGEYSYAG